MDEAHLCFGDIYCICRLKPSKKLCSRDLPSMNLKPTYVFYPQTFCFVSPFKRAFLLCFFFFVLLCSSQKRIPSLFQVKVNTPDFSSCPEGRSSHCPAGEENTRHCPGVVLDHWGYNTCEELSSNGLLTHLDGMCVSLSLSHTQKHVTKFPQTSSPLKATED